jgi:hypothetical protein
MEGTSFVFRLQASGEIGIFPSIRSAGLQWDLIDMRRPYILRSKEA